MWIRREAYRLSFALLLLWCACMVGLIYKTGSSPTPYHDIFVAEDPSLDYPSDFNVVRVYADGRREVRGTCHAGACFALNPGG